MTYIRSPRSLADLVSGEHLCGLYETEDEHCAVLTTFMRQGLTRGEKVIYIVGDVPGRSAVDSPLAEAALGCLMDEGLEVELCLARGQLVICTHDDIYTPKGVFEPDSVVARLGDETERALAEGFAALRVACEMSWLQQEVLDARQVVAFEARLNDFLRGKQCMILCLYDRRRLDPAVLLDALRTHPVAAVGTAIHDNFYYIPPGEMLSSNPSAAELRHWLDNLSNRQQMEEKCRAYRDHVEGLVSQRAVYQHLDGVGLARARPPAVLPWAQAPEQASLQREITRQVWAKTALRQRDHELALLNRVGQVFGAMRDQDQVLVTVLEVARRLLDVVACLAWLQDPETGDLVCHHAAGPYGKTLRGRRLSPGEGLVGQVAQGGEGLIVPDVRADAQHTRDAERPGDLVFHSALGVPLRVKGNVVGVIQALDTQVARFRPADLVLVKSLALSASAAIENAWLYREARASSVSGEIPCARASASTPA